MHGMKQENTQNTDSVINIFEYISPIQGIIKQNKIQMYKYTKQKSLIQDN